MNRYDSPKSFSFEFKCRSYKNSIVNKSKTELLLGTQAIRAEGMFLTIPHRHLHKGALCQAAESKGSSEDGSGEERLKPVLNLGN